jgi:succinyl-CoA synthetase alpha subunit
MIIRGSDSVLVMGITGKQGTFWADKMAAYGTCIAGGTNPKRAGEHHLGRPVWATAVDATREQPIDAAVLFIPPFGVKEALLDAIAAIGRIVCLTEHPGARHHVCARRRRRARARVVGPATTASSPPAKASSVAV